MWAAAAFSFSGGVLTGILVWCTGMWLLQHVGSGRLYERLRQLSVPPREGARRQAAAPGSLVRNRRYSDLPKLRRFISGLAITPKILLFLEQAGSKMTVSVYLLLHGCCAMTGLLFAFMIHAPAPVGLALAGIATPVPFFILSMKRRRRFRQLCEQLPEAIRLITAAMRAGSGLDVGLNLIAQELPEPISGEFLKLSNEAQLYADMNEALKRLSRRLPVPDIRLFAASASLHREIGGNFVELLEQLEQTVRTRIQLYRELKTLTAESRLSGWVLVALPVVVALGIFVTNPTYLLPLVEIETGRTMLWTSLGLQLAGLVIIRWQTTPRIQ